MKLVSTEITDLKAEFEGGKSLSVDWYGILRRASESMLGQIYPETLKRRVPVYGGLSKDLKIYFCPTDVLVPSDLYPMTGEREYTYKPPAHFYANPTENTFTIEYINKVRFLVVRHAWSPSLLEVNAMDAVGSIGGTATPVLNEFNFLEGTGAIQATFDDSGKYFSETLATALDISDYLNGVAVVPVNWADGDIVASVTLQLLTSVGNYYQVTTTVDSIGDNFIDGWNLLRFALAGRTSSGSPSAASIASWKLIITMESGQSQTVIVDRLSIQKSKAHDFEYYSNLAFVDGDTGSFKLVPESNDYINLDRDAQNILHYEACRKVGRPSISGLDFTQELLREYEQYHLLHPSSAKPLSYSVAPDIPIGMQQNVPFPDPIDRYDPDTDA